MSKVKKKDHENLTEANIRKVIDLLEAEKPITKKVACEILNIAYNTTRLTKIIEEFKYNEAEQSRKKAANRGKPATDFEKQVIIENYLDATPITEIAKRIYRSPAFVKDIIEQVGVPQKPVAADYWNPSIIPEQCSREEFEVGQIVWSAKRHCMVIIIQEQKNVRDKENKYYQTWVIEPIEEPSPYFPQYQDYGGYYDGSYAYDLGSLEHLKDYGVDIYKPYKSSFAKWLKE